jgi:hypothetical protein
MASHCFRCGHNYLDVVGISDTDRVVLRFNATFCFVLDLLCMLYDNVVLMPTYALVDL